MVRELVAFLYHQTLQVVTVFFGDICKGRTDKFAFVDTNEKQKCQRKSSQVKSNKQFATIKK